MRVFFVADTKDFTPKLFLDALRKYVKGFVRLGHDTQVFSCNLAVSFVNPIRWPALSRVCFRKRAVEVLLRQLALYKPDIVFVGLPKMVYLYAISGAKMGLSINLANDIQLYHSDRLTHYLACGTLVLARQVPDSDQMFEDDVHLRYFDTEDGFFELVERYLREESQRKRIARTGMDWIHREFNSVKIVERMLEAVETGSYRAPWFAGT